MNLVVFAGAGCSMLPPTNLPSWWNLNRAVIDALAAEAHHELPEARVLGDLVVARQDELKFPPEYFAEVVTGVVGATYFDVLRALDSDVPNAVHEALARLAAAGQLRAIVTTNFDRAIEAAFAAHGVPLDVRSRPEQMEELAANLEWLDATNGACQLLKIHGSADAPDTLVDTLSQRKRGLPAATVACIRHLLVWGRWLFAGYSGADLDADPNYLFLRARKEEAQGFTWLVREGTEPLAAVRDLVDFYQTKASIERGLLPEWLEGRLAASAPSLPPLAPPGPSESAAAVPVGERVKAWAEHLGGFTCATILAALADAAGHAKAALPAFERLYRAHPFSARAIEGEADRYGGGFVEASPVAHRAYSLAAARLAILLRDQGRVDEAFAAGRHALAAGAASRSAETLAPLVGQFGNLQRHTGDLTGAERTFARGIALAAQLPWISADLENDLAAVFNAQGRHGDALAAVKRAHEIRARIGDEMGRAGALVNLATLSPPRQAEQWLREALTVFERLGNESARGNVLINFGKLYQAAGNWLRSFECYEDAREAAEIVGDSRMRAMALHGQAVARDEQQETDAALALYRRALEVATSIGFKSEQASIHNNLARFHRDRKDAEKTTRERRLALSLYEEMHSAKGKADTWYAMGVDAYVLGRLPETVEPFRLAFEEYKTLQEPKRRLESGHNYASALYDNGRADEARRVYEESLPDAEAQENRLLIVKILSGLGRCAFKSDRAADGVVLFQEAVARQLGFEGLEAAWSLAETMAESLRDEFGYPNASRLDFLADALDAAARESAAKEHYDAALEYLEPLRSMAAKAGDATWLARAEANIGYVHRQAGRGAQAISSLMQSIEHYRAERNAKGALFPLSHLIPLLEERGGAEATSDAWQELAACYQAVGQPEEAGDAFARAARQWLLAFASGEVTSADDARLRATRAHALLVAAQPLLEEGSPMHQAVEYDLAFCRQILAPEQLA